MQKLKKRKGFTLTELAIVIAVIAILIAVLVPTFISLINKAKESNDSQLAKNMNTTLSTYAAINGDVDTPHEAISALEEDGYLIKNMTPTSDGYSYIWDESTNTVALIDSEFNFVYNTGSSELSTDEEDTTLWAIVSTQSQANTFINSKYAFKYCVVATESVTVNNSFDSYYAEDANVTLVADGKSYTMYTNGGEYTINAANATVEHYGTASLVNVTAVDPTNSYHVYGEVKMVVLTEGHLVVEEDATVSILAINAAAGKTTSIAVESVNVSDSIGTIYTTSSTTSVSVTTSSGTTTATAITSSSIADESGNVTISGITYITTEEQFESFIESGAGMAILKANVTIESTIALDSGEFVSIDLNGYTLTSSCSDTNNITNESELTISNGKLVFDSMQKATTATFSAETNSKITFNNVVAKTNGSMLYPKGDASEVNVINSTITTTGSYCVATNASTEYTVTITLQNSILSAVGNSSKYGCAVLINIPGTLYIDGCTITGDLVGALIRGGEATIKNSVITSNCAYNNGVDKWGFDTTWDTGDCVPMGALVVGNHRSDYQYTTTCTLDNVTLNVGSSTTTKKTPSTAVFMWSSNGYKVYLNYTNCNITDADINGRGVYNDSESAGGCYINDSLAEEYCYEVTD